VAWSWLAEGWFDGVQTVGILGSLWVAICSIREQVKSRRLTDLLTLAAHHRDLWSEVHRRPDLARICDREVRLSGHPMTLPEREFMNLVINHFHTGWLVACRGGLVSRHTLATDAGYFFRLPLPRAAWDQTKFQQDPRFVQFIENSTASTTSSP
jgi:hypothetical protein